METISERLDEVSAMPFFCLSIDSNLRASYSTKHKIGDAQHLGGTGSNHRTSMVTF